MQKTFRKDVHDYISTEGFLNTNYGIVCHAHHRVTIINLPRHNILIKMGISVGTTGITL